MKRVFCALFVATFVFSSCTLLDRTPSIYYNEEELSLGDITEMRHSFVEDESANQTAVLVPYDETYVDVAVYWTENGKVWHLTPRCGYLKSGSQIIYGSRENAEKCGKTRVCSSCEK